MMMVVETGVQRELQQQPQPQPQPHPQPRHRSAPAVTHPSRTLCFAAAQGDPSILRDRGRLTEFYLKQVALMAKERARLKQQQHHRRQQRNALSMKSESKGEEPLSPPPPPPARDQFDLVPAHVPAVDQPAGSTKTIRVVQWNINVLHGPDNVSFGLPQSASAVADVLQRLNADVLLLQEAWKLSYPAGKAPNWPDSSGRVGDLIELLPSLGYKVVACDGDGAPNNFNPSILATRLPVVNAGESFSTDRGRHEFADAMEAQRSPELRGARIVDLALGNSAQELEDAANGDAPVLTTVITHFHHNEAPAAPHFGIRRGEAAAIIAECDRWAQQKRRRKSRARACSAATLVATDFNGVRKADLAPHEWKLHAHCMASLGQPADDGVAATFERHGFQCTYDAPGMSTPSLTHWTNTVLDFAYLRVSSGNDSSGLESRPADETANDSDETANDSDETPRSCSKKSPSGSWRVKAVHVVPTTVSDHLPVVHDLVFDPAS